MAETDVIVEQTRPLEGSWATRAAIRTLARPVLKSREQDLDGFRLGADLKRVEGSHDRGPFRLVAVAR